MNDFFLEKWYFDAVDENGNAFVGYSARSKWKLLNLIYNGYNFISNKEGSKTVKRGSFRLNNSPDIKDSSISWNCMRLKGEWTRIDSQFNEVLYANTDGDIRWSCIFPKANASFSHDGETFKAFGYIDKVEVSLPPWKVPVSRLQWGRFHSKDQTLVWLNWVGPAPKTFIFHNGKKITNGVITDQVISFQNADLTIGDNRPLIKGTILSTIFASFTSLLKLFPKSMMAMRLSRSVSQGILTIDGQPNPGWVIQGETIWE